MYPTPPLGDDANSDPIRLADWVESNVMTEEEDVISVSSVADALGDIPPDDSAASEQRNDQDGDSERDDNEPRHGYWGDAESTAEAVFQELADRASWLGNHYPIAVEKDVATLREDSCSSDLYRFLVLLRARQMHQRALEDDGAEPGFLFECLAKFAVGAYIGAEQENRIRFGLAGGNRGGGLPFSIHDAIEKLSDMLSEEPGTVPVGAQGDYRVDVVAWKPFGDRRSGQLVALCQSTITEGRWHKAEPATKWTARLSPDTRLIRFLAQPITAVAFPETLSLTSLTTLKGLDVSSVPMDRLRLVSLLCDHDIPLALLERMNAWSTGFSKRLMS